MFFVDSKFFLPHLCLLHQFVTDPAAPVFRVIGHQMVSLICSVFQKEKAQLLSLFLNRWCFLHRFSSTVFVFGVQCTYLCWQSWMKCWTDSSKKQGPLQSPQRIETSDTSGDETNTNKGFRKILSQKTFRMEKVYGTTELGRFFVTRSTYAVNKPNHFYCRVCLKDVSIFTHGHHKVLRQFQGSRHFARDQRLRLETPGWRVLNFHGNTLSEDELERQRGKIKKSPVVVRDC